MDGPPLSFRQLQEAKTIGHSAAASPRILSLSHSTQQPHIRFSLCMCFVRLCIRTVDGRVCNVPMWTYVYIHERPFTVVRRLPFYLRRVCVFVPQNLFTIKQIRMHPCLYYSYARKYILYMNSHHCRRILGRWIIWHYTASCWIAVPNYYDS